MKIAMTASEAAPYVKSGGLGYTFQSYNGDDFWGAIDRCLGLYWHDQDGWKDLIRRDMSADFSWKKPAEKYMELFHRLKG